MSYENKVTITKMMTDVYYNNLFLDILLTLSKSNASILKMKKASDSKGRKESKIIANQQKNTTILTCFISHLLLVM